MKDLLQTKLTQRVVELQDEVEFIRGQRDHWHQLAVEQAEKLDAVAERLQDAADYSCKSEWDQRQYDELMVELREMLDPADQFQNPEDREHSEENRRNNQIVSSHTDNGTHEDG